MKICFDIDCHTLWGETVYLSGSIPPLGGGDCSLAFECACLGNDRWRAQAELPSDTPDFEYRYLIRDEKGECRTEQGPARSFVKRPGIERLLVRDSWQDAPLERSFFSSFFVKGIFRRPLPDKTLRLKPAAALIQVCAPEVRPCETLVLCGSIPALGNWDPAKAPAMNDARYPRWEALLEGEAAKTPFEYKFLLIEKDSGRVLAWEEGENRRFRPQTIAEKQASIVTAKAPKFPRSRWHGAGTAIPVFSLRSEEDFGVGDFLDLKKMADWAAATGQSVLQILPVNDTTMHGSWRDSYPYNANSSFALHPMYLRLSELGRLADDKRQKHYDALARELNSLEEVDYERVVRAKESFAREIFRQEGERVLSTKEFKRFLRRNRGWLKPYAAFCLLRDEFSTAEFSKWGEYAIYDEKKIRKLAKERPQEFDYVYYLQYNLDRQLTQVRDYARSRGVALKGDIPIGISRTSADAWTSPELFNLSCQAGAPPDDFSLLGQNWGFLTYDWPRMKQEGYAWWKSRLGKMSEYFDAYRIDHVLGFFRIWQIPMESVHGLRGMFSPALPLTPGEMLQGYGFRFDAESHARVWTTDKELDELFGECASIAKTRFLEEAGPGRCIPKPEADTQLKVVEHFAREKETETGCRLRSGMMALLDEVLFVEDLREKGKYHPRIAASGSHAYARLKEDQKRCFDRLYDDYYYRRHEEFWKSSAMEKLPELIQATGMLACAEDLGMIPDCVPSVLDALQILSLEIQRMPKTPGIEFADTRSYPYRSVCATSTHDMSGIRLWWEEDSDKSRRFYEKALKDSGDPPMKATPEICKEIIRMHLDSPSMLCILPLQDWLATDSGLRRKDPQKERINDPSNPCHYWRYRMHLTLEELIASAKFNSCVKEMIASSGR